MLGRKHDGVNLKSLLAGSLCREGHEQGTAGQAHTCSEDSVRWTRSRVTGSNYFSVVTLVSITNYCFKVHPGSRLSKDEEARRKDAEKVEVIGTKILMGDTSVFLIFYYFQAGTPTKGKGKRSKASDNRSPSGKNPSKVQTE